MDKSVLGLPIVTVKKILDDKHIIENFDDGLDIHTAIVDYKGDDIIIGILPDLDHNKIMEGDRAIYDNSEGGSNMICRIIDCITPGKIPETTFEDIGGLDDQIKDVKEILEIFERKDRKNADELKMKFSNGVLFFGPPGTGKTMLGEAAANYARMPFFFINTPELFGMHLGESVGRLKAVHTSAAKFAKREGGAILYFDEITRLGAARNYTGGADSEVSAVTEELQALMNGDHYIKNDEGVILYMASTNLEKIMDSAVLRRFKTHVRVPPPSRAGKEGILNVKIQNIPSKDINIVNIIQKLEEIKATSTGADIDIVTEKAKRYAQKGGRAYLNNVDFEQSLDDFSYRVDVLLAKK